MWSRSRRYRRISYFGISACLISTNHLETYLTWNREGSCCSEQHIGSNTKREIQTKRHSEHCQTLRGQRLRARIECFSKDNGRSQTLTDLDCVELQCLRETSSQEVVIFSTFRMKAERSVLLRATVKTAAAALGPVEWNVYLHLFIFSVLYVQCKKKWKCEYHHSETVWLKTAEARRPAVEPKWSH